MKYFILLINLFLTIICFTTIPGTFDSRSVLSGYITPENNMLIFSININGKVGLYKYEMDSNSILYTKKKK